MIGVSILTAGPTEHPLTAHGRIEQMWDGVVGLTDMPDDDLDVPGATEQTFAVSYPTSRPFAVGMLLLGADPDTGLVPVDDPTAMGLFYDNVADLGALLWSPAAPLHLQRRVPSAAGEQVHDAYGRYLGGLNPAMEDPTAGRVVLRFKLLTPTWFDGSTPVTY